ncbi:unnamed protein product [Adineta ricciae]|uniref:Uncharacterized protein n=1 Tax=Adineta ricciae TaxID=249248 RepID=A0A816GCS0_ADIRI|nr:unnamed protein product [Adineta ricciae]
MSLLKEFWERLFHWSNITHIANARDEDIWVSFYSTNITIQPSNIELALQKGQPHAGINIKLNQGSNTSWFKVPSRCFHRYNRRAKTEKISIVRDSKAARNQETANENTGNVLLADYLVHQNYSYVVTKNGGFLQQKYGSRNLFEDFNGYCHLTEKKVSTPSDSNTCIYVSVLLGAALSCCVFRHRITNSAFFQNLQKKFQ